MATTVHASEDNLTVSPLSLSLSVFFHPDFIISTTFSVSLSAARLPSWPPSVHVSASVTRFGEILPLGQNLKSLGQFLSSYLVFGKIVNLLCQIFYNCWANFHYSKWPNVEEII